MTLVLVVIPCELVFHFTPFNLSVYSLPLQLRVRVYVSFCYSCILASYQIHRSIISMIILSVQLRCIVAGYIMSRFSQCNQTVNTIDNIISSNMVIRSKTHYLGVNAGTDMVTIL